LEYTAVRATASPQKQASQPGEVVLSRESSSGVIVLIPAFRPTDDLIALVEQLRSAPLCDAIYVVDDGSNNEPSRRIVDQAAQAGAIVLRHAVNLGKGMAIRTGLNMIAVSHPNAAGVVTCDADGQHLVEDVLAVAAALHADPECLIMGCRKMPADAPWRSRVGNGLTRHVLRFFTAMKISDTQTGLRGIPGSLIPVLLRLRSSGYDFELDMLMAAHRQKRAVVEVPIATVYRDGNATSHFNPVWDSMKIYFVFLRFSSVSLLTALIDYLVFSLAYTLTGQLLWAMLSGRLLAASFQFAMSFSFVFRQRQRRGRALLKYGLVLIVLTGLAYWGISSLQRYLQWTPYISKLLVEGSIFLLSFLLLRDFVFAEQESEG
jgi:putative flippase GtrA